MRARVQVSARMQMLPQAMALSLLQARGQW
jgi:hypothetical protein